MELNANKFQLITHRYSTNDNLIRNLPFNGSYFCYKTANGTDLSTEPFVRDLGVVFSEDMSWSKHIQTIVTNANTMAAWTLNVFSSRAPFVMLTLYKSLVRSRLEYCSPVWTSSKLGNIRLLENVQRSFTAKIDGMSYYDYWGRLSALRLSSLQRRRERFIIFHMWKILYSKVPNDLDLEFIHRNDHIKAVLKPLPRCSARAQSLYEDSFVIYGVKLWNIVPRTATIVDSFPAFKVVVDAFLEGIPDRPPLEGYPYTSSNSLLELVRQSR